MPDGVHFVVSLFTNRHAVPEELVIVNLLHGIPHSQCNRAEVEEMFIWNWITNGMEDGITSCGN